MDQIMGKTECSAKNSVFNDIMFKKNFSLILSSILVSDEDLKPKYPYDDHFGLIWFIGIE